MAEMLNIHICLTSRIFEQAGCWRNRVFLAISKHLKIVGFPPLQKKIRYFDVPEPSF
jgi:hypothetical protein